MSKKIPVGQAVDEVDGLALGDARLNERVRRLVGALERDPAAGFPSAVGTVAEREATYRLLRNRRVTMDGLMAPHAEQTVLRAGALDEQPLVVIDKSSFVFGGESDRDGLTRLGANRQGFDAFVGLAVSQSRMPLGVLAIEPLEGQSGRSGAADWHKAVAAADQHIAPLEPIYVMDREADSYELFAQLMAAMGRDFVVRVAADRWVREHDGAVKEMLSTIAARAPMIMQRTVKLARRSGAGKPLGARRRNPPRDAREATLTVRACSIVLPRPQKLSTELPLSLEVQLVQVIEESPPADAKPVEWLLLTTLPVDDEADVARIVDIYRARWTIEEYFKALKSGCSYEKRQLESRHALLNALGLLAPLAWRLLALRSMAGDEAAPASAVLEADELHVLRKISRDIQLGPEPTAAEALYAVARIGGHFPQNGRPGWKVIWTGFHKLLAQVDGYRLALADLAQPGRRCDQ